MIEYYAGLLLVSVGIYAMLLKDHLVKKIMGLALISEGIHLLLITLGFRHTFETALPPILQLENLSFATQAVDPLPQALVLTSIVINFSITAFALMLALKVYEKTKTLRSGEWE